MFEALLTENLHLLPNIFGDDHFGLSFSFFKRHSGKVRACEELLYWWHLLENVISNNLLNDSLSII